MMIGCSNYQTASRRGGMLPPEYFPDAIPETAVHHLMRWITGCAPLAEALAKTGYQSRNRSLTWRQVLLIRSFLGETAEQEKPSEPSFPLDGHKQT